MKTTLLTITTIATIATALVGQVHAQNWLTNELAAYYPFSGTANDASGNGMHGVVHGATLTADRNLLLQCAYRFNGTSWVQLPSTILPLPCSEVTISAWVRADSASSTTQGIIVGLAGGRGECQLLTRSSGRWEFWIKLANSQQFAAQSQVLTNEWVNLVGTYNRGQSMQLWVNGSLAQSNTVPDQPLFANPGFPLNSAIGIYDYLSGPYDGFKGAIDDVRIYTRALSASEVLQVYESELPAPCHRRAAAAATLVNGFVVDATVTDGGCGYTSIPLVLIQGGGGSGAAATAVLNNGVVTGITMTDAGFGYTNTPNFYIYSPLGLQIGLLKAVKPAFTDLFPGTNYQLQVSADMNTWTNQGSPFIATDPAMMYPQYWDVENWQSLYFRLQVVP